MLDDGEREVVFTREEDGDFFLIHFFIDGGDVGLHDVGDSDIAAGFEELLEGDDAFQVIGAVQDVDVVHRFELVVDLFSDVSDGLIDVHIGADTGEARTHEPTGFIFFVGHERGDFFSGTFGQIAFELVSELITVDELQDVSGIIGRERSEVMALIFLVKLFQEADLVFARNA